MIAVLAVRSVAAAGRTEPGTPGGSFSGRVECAGSQGPTSSAAAPARHCRGSSPGRNGAADWHQVLDANDPIEASRRTRSSAGEGDLHDSKKAVYPTLGRGRVLLVRPPEHAHRSEGHSTPRAQPHAVDDEDVDDLHPCASKKIDDPSPTCSSRTPTAALTLAELAHRASRPRGSAGS